MQGPDAVLELVDQFLLIAAFVSAEHNLFGRRRCIVGYVEEVPNIIEQHIFAAFDRKILAQFLCPNEERVFEILGWPWVDPWDRTEETAIELRRSLR